MRLLKILAAQLAFSMFLAASVMPLVVITVPAVRSEPGVGLALLIGVSAASFVITTALWPWRRQ